MGAATLNHILYAWNRTLIDAATQPVRPRRNLSPRRSRSASRHHDNSGENHHASADHITDVLRGACAAVKAVSDARACFRRLSDQRVFAVQALDKEGDTADDKHEADDGFHV